MGQRRQAVCLHQWACLMGPLHCWTQDQRSLGLWRVSVRALTAAVEACWTAVSCSVSLSSLGCLPVGDAPGRGR